MKTKLLAVLIFLGTYVNSQLYIGQKSEEVLYFVNQSSQAKGWYIEKEFDNGKLSEIIIYKPKQTHYDLDAFTESIDRIVINEKNQYAYSLSQFPELSLKYVTEKFDKYYSDYKIDDYYFTKDYQNFRKLSITDGYATVLYSKAYIDSFPTSMKKEIEKRLKNSEQQKIKKEEIREEIYHLENDYFDIAEYDTIATDKIYLQIETLAIRHLFDDLTIKNGEQKQIREHFKLKLKSSKQREKVSGGILQNMSEKSYSFYPQSFENINIGLPFIKEEYNGKDYELNRYAEVNLTYDVIAGMVNVKKKKSGIQILNNPNLSNEYQSAIEDFLKNENNGIYTVKYQFGLVNNINALRIVAEKTK